MRLWQILGWDPGYPGRHPPSYPSPLVRYINRRLSGASVADAAKELDLRSWLPGDGAQVPDL